MQHPDTDSPFREESPSGSTDPGAAQGPVAIDPGRVVQPVEPLPDPEGPAGKTSPYLRLYEQKLELLRRVLTLRHACLMPVLRPFAPHGHAIPLADDILGVKEGESFEDLEELADLGLLKRELHNLVQVCPACERCQINFREHCTFCHAIDLEVENMVHHFRCSYTGVESEFASGFDLACPKCRRVLHQLGQDFDRPSIVYVCRECKRLSEEPDLSAQCLHCDKEFPASALEPSRVHRYRPTLLAIRAVELNRLTGLDVTEVMFDSQIGLATPEFLDMQMRRELARLNRYGAPFAGATLCFKHRGAAFPIFREWTSQDLRQLGRSITGSLRTLDLVSRLDSARIGILFPETDTVGVLAVRQRFSEQMDHFILHSNTGHVLEATWTDHAWTDPDTDLDQVLAFFSGEKGQEIDLGGISEDGDWEDSAGGALRAAGLDEDGEESPTPLMDEADWAGPEPMNEWTAATTAPLDDVVSEAEDDDDFFDEQDKEEEVVDLLDRFDNLLGRLQDEEDGW